MKLLENIKNRIKENSKKEINKSSEDFFVSTTLILMSGITFIFGMQIFTGYSIDANIKVGIFLILGSIVLFVPGLKIKKDNWKNEN